MRIGARREQFRQGIGIACDFKQRKNAQNGRLQRCITLHAHAVQQRPAVFVHVA